MQRTLYYIFLISFLYALISIPMPNGDWQEYLLLGASLAMPILALEEHVGFEKTKLYKALIVTAIFLGVYGIIFYMSSDWSSLETTSLVILCIPPLVNFVRFLVVGKKS